MKLGSATLAGFGLLALGSFLPQVFSIGPREVPSELRAKRFVVESEDGKEIGEFGLNEHNVAVMSLRGVDAPARGALTVSGGQATFSLTNATGKPRFEAWVQPDGAVVMSVFSDKGEPVVQLGSFPGGIERFAIQKAGGDRGLVYLSQPTGDQALRLVGSNVLERVELTMSPKTGGNVQVTNEANVVLFEARPAP